jgi:hypothetical protein
LRAVAGDSLLVLDERGLTLISPTGGCVRSKALPLSVRGFRIGVLPDQRIIVNNYIPPGPSLALLNDRFEIVRTFGPTTAMVPSGALTDPDELQEQVAILTSGLVAATRVNFAYAIELWDTTGHLHSRVLPRPNWYVPWSPLPAEQRERAEPQRTRIVATHADAGGRLWIAGMSPGRAGGRVDQNAINREPPATGLWDTVIEVRDPESGRLIAARRFRGLRNHFLENGDIWAPESAVDGLRSVGIWRATLR